ncbi:MAG: NAD-glutamate dehydrogenase [Pseudomonadales bacterium]|nr:NAD-glutamate dehydrogenase [Pseudomonadales bacterium]
MTNQASNGVAQPSNPAWESAFFKGLEEDTARLYAEAFSAGYQYDFSVEEAYADIDMLEALHGDQEIAMRLYRNTDDAGGVLRFRLARKGSQIALSDVLPLLENFGLRVIGGRPYELATTKNEHISLHVFELEAGADSKFDSNSIDTGALAANFEAAFLRVWQGSVESDGFNRLVLSCGLSWRQVEMLRAYSRYMKQINLPYTRIYTSATLARYGEITAQLVQLFETRFAPDSGLEPEPRAQAANEQEAAIVQALESVSNLTEDQIIRQYLTLMSATLRCNYYQRERFVERNYLAFKFDVQSIPEAPKPRPMYEIFVYSAEFEGVHLRGGKVARGGLRWSDRHEDFRTEVLGLVKAQQVKNSVIVPMGAKGGFVCKREPQETGRDAFIANGVHCYRQFISALLELTDNLVNDAIVPPEAVVCHDGEDPYLVVAADKGTATFSDIANEISEGKNFWLGDAFASGGSVGYDHKKMGITAKGAWVSVQRHFRELGVHVQEQDFSVVAIGDMGGDVFGNGMLCSQHICLLAAFNHQHIFIDPNPDAGKSFNERERLFNAQGSSWQDYNSDLISPGGGVFSRSAKSIGLSEQIRQRFAIQATELTPNELITALLKAQVDLLWNGGIGTYAKASDETHAEVGDRANDGLRVNACDLGARVLGEGGNLGITQLARVEFALHGGRCNTDFIDNAAGVDCSDHEVNIKILLNTLVQDASLDLAQRNDLLYSMTGQVSELVLHNNYRQTQAISLAEFEAGIRDVEYRRLVNHFESEGALDRALEFIPGDEELAERKAYDKAMTRPELSVLVSYAKLGLKQALAAASVAQDDYVAQAALNAFPPQLRETYRDRIAAHRLHNEIVATQVSSDIVNRMGISFVHRMQQATGESELNIAKAYVAARDLFDIEAQWQAIEALDYTVSTDMQHRLFLQLVRLARRATRWLLRERRALLDPGTELASYAPAVAYLKANVTKLLSGKQRERWQSDVDEFVTANVPQALAEFVASTRYAFNAFSVATVLDKSDAGVEQVARCYFALGEKLELNWFADQIAHMQVESYWQALARESFRDELEGQQAELVASLLDHAPGASDAKAIDLWMEKHRAYIERWQTMTAELRCVAEFDLAMFPVAIRELLDLSQASQKAA